MLIAGSVGAFGLYFLLLHVMHGAGATLSTKLDVAKTALLVVGGSGAVAGLYVAYRKQRTDEANHLRDQDKLFTERYTAAAAQLGNPAAAVRLAGVYALARIADDSERDRPTCLSVLCAYLRMPYDPDEPATDKAERQVRTTAQTAIAARLRPDHLGFWPDAEIDLNGACLIDLKLEGVTVRTFTADGATFTGDARFDKATFTGDAGFDKATFGSAAFGGAAFNGNAWFDEATFTGIAWFGGATFSGTAGFDEATFTGDAWFRAAAFNGTAGFDQRRSLGMPGSAGRRSSRTPGSARRHSQGTPSSSGRRSAEPSGSTRRHSPGMPGSAARHSAEPPNSTGPRSPETPGSAGRHLQGMPGSAGRRSAGIVRRCGRMGSPSRPGSSGTPRTRPRREIPGLSAA